MSEPGPDGGEEVAEEKYRVPAMAVEAVPVASTSGADVQVKSEPTDRPDSGESGSDHEGSPEPDAPASPRTATVPGGCGPADAAARRERRQRGRRRGRGRRRRRGQEQQEQRPPAPATATAPPAAAARPARLRRRRHRYHHHHHHHHRGHRSRSSSSRSRSPSGSPSGSPYSSSQSRSRSPSRAAPSGRRGSLDSSPASGLTPTPGSARPSPVPERSQPQPCFVPGCPWRGGLDQVTTHARERHASIIAAGPAVRLAVPLLDNQDLDLLRVVDAGGELFLLQLRRRPGLKRRLQAAVRLLGPRTRAANYMYLIQMQVGEGEGGDGATRVSFLVSPAHSWLEPPETSMRSLWSARHYARPLQRGDQEHRVLELSVSIQKVQQQQQQQQQ